MFIVRSVSPQDLEQIFELSQLMKFINIPDDLTLLSEKIELSQKSFAGKAGTDHGLYIFVLEDLIKRKVIGVSLIHGKHGNEKEPHFFLKVDREEKYSKSLNTGFIHGTLQFGHTTDGYTEIGGLILSPEYRKSAWKLGKALSFARFLFIGKNPQLFTDTIHVELMPPFDSEGRSPLWEAVGRKFLNMDYHEADILSRKNKEFILSLFPQATIYEPLLPLDARDAIGKVGKETEPVKRMLESVGFMYINEVDPFDGGPHYRARRDQIKVIQEIDEVNISFSKNRENKLKLIEVKNDDHPFYCVILKGEEKKREFIVDPSFQKVLIQKTGRGFSY